MTTEKKDNGFGTINVPITLTKKSVDDTLTTAIEGGSYYWCQMNPNDIETAENWLETQIKEGILKRDKSVHYKFLDAMFQGYKGSIALVDSEDYDEILGYLTMKDIKRGLKQVAKERPDIFSQHFPEYNNGDSLSADVIFQYIVLGEIVYG